MSGPFIFRALNTRMPLLPAQQRVVTIIMPLFILLVGIAVVAFQLLHLTFVHAQAPARYVAIATPRSPRVPYSQDQGQTNPQQRITLSINLYPSQQTRAILGSTHHDPALTHQLPAVTMALSLPNTTTTLSQYLQHRGFAITSAQPLSITLRGTIKQAQQTFQVSIHTYATPAGQIYYSNTNPPRLPANLAAHIVNIAGLNNIQQTQIIYRGIKLTLIPHHR